MICQIYVVLILIALLHFALDTIYNSKVNFRVNCGLNIIPARQ